MDKNMDDSVKMSKFQFTEGVNQFSPTTRGNFIVLSNFVFLAFLGIPLTFLAFLGITVGLVTGKLPLSVESLLVFLGFAIFSFASPKGFLVMINIIPKIRVIKEGIMIRLIRFKYTWKFVPWNEMIEIIESRKHDIGGAIPVLIVKKASSEHSSFAKRYVSNSNPGIVLSSQIQNRERLIEIIHEKIGVDHV